MSIVKEQVCGGEPLGAGRTISAMVMGQPIRITRLADMTQFEAEFRPVS